jgi:hypothetical protein
MPSLPDIKGANRLKPLGYDPQTRKYILYDDIINGRAEIVPLNKLTDAQIKELVAERQRVGPDYTMANLKGEMRTRDEIVQEILNETDFGKMMVQAEKSYLSDFLKQIEAALADPENKPE